MSRTVQDGWLVLEWCQDMPGQRCLKGSDSHLDKKISHLDHISWHFEFHWLSLCKDHQVPFHETFTMNLDTDMWKCGTIEIVIESNCWCHDPDCWCTFLMRKACFLLGCPISDFFVLSQNWRTHTNECASSIFSTRPSYWWQSPFQQVVGRSFKHIRLISLNRS